jgi:hypothetical protein
MLDFIESLAHHQSQSTKVTLCELTHTSPSADPLAQLHCRVGCFEILSGSSIIFNVDISQIRVHAVRAVARNRPQWNSTVPYWRRGRNLSLH